MARERENAKAKKYPYGGGRVEGNLAYDFDYEERLTRRNESRREERTQSASASAPAPRRHQKVQTTVRTRERQRVSPAALVGFTALAAMIVVLIMSYAQLTAISSNVVSMQKELAALEEEHVALLTQYEKTFDLATIKEAAEAAGMAKPSASQIYYVDLSAPDSVVVYQQAGTSVLSRVFTSLGRGACSVVEYFK